MRFLFNTVHYKPAKGAGGPIHSVAAFAEGLVARGHEVMVAASNGDIPGTLNVDTDRDHQVDGVRVRYFKMRPTLLQRTGIPMFSRAGVFTFGPEFRQWMHSLSGSIDLVHSQISLNFSNRHFARFAQKEQIPYIYQQRGCLDPIRIRHGYIKKRIYIALVEQPIMRRAAALIALTDYEAKTYRALGLRNRIEVIPNGIDPEFGSQSGKTSRADLQALLARLGDRFVFLFLSRIHPIKGPEIFAEAFIHCARLNPSVEAILAGPDEFGRVAKIMSIVEEAGLGNRFHYVGVATKQDKIALFQRANSLVLPTESEGMSMVLLESLACGCPIITCPGAYFDDIKTSGAGLVVNRTASDVADAMNKFIGEGRDRLKERAEAGKLLIRHSYSWASIVERYEKLCFELSRSRH